MIFKICVLFITLFSSFVSANVIQLTSDTKSISILPQADVFIDIDATHTFEHVLLNSSVMFHANKKDMIHLGYTKEAVWVKFRFKNTSNEVVQRVLELSNPMIDNVSLYVQEDDDSFKEEKNGVLSQKNYQSSVLHLCFDISIKPKQTKEYYLRVSTSSCALYFKLKLLNKDTFYKKETVHQLILTLFFGSIITLILYNLFIYIFTKELAYLYYVLYLFFIVLEHLSYTTLNKYIYSKSLFDIDAYMAIFYIAVVSIFGILFIREFLNVYKYKILDNIFKIFLLLDIIFIFISLQKIYPINLVVSTSMFALIYILYVSFYLLYKGNKNAKYMILGWSVTIFAWIMQGTYNEGGWSLLSTYPYLFEASIFFEAIVFSIALANKLNKTKELEKSVKSNKILTKELHHRVKNNMQLIISMYRLKLAKFKNVSNSLKEVEGAIQAIGTTHEMLYSNNIALNTDTKKYFIMLVDKLKNSYNNVDIDIKLHVDTNIDINYLIYLGIILNELMTNTYKYAFDSTEGRILIILKKIDKKVTFIYEDNGKGYEPNINHNSFGLELVKNLVESELQGTFDVSFHNGTKYIISF